MKMDPKKSLFLIDGSSFLYRAYYGTRPLHTSKGEPVNAVYSFCRMIQKLIERFSIENIALVWDSKGPTIRHEIFQDYKATRQAPPSDLFDQKGRISEIADLIGLKQVAKQGYEADDLMYSIGRDMAKEGHQVIIVSSDKDMGQMLDEQTMLYDYFKDILYDVPAFEEKMGMPIAKLPFYFALLGDSSDNIPGVKGIGKKGALELVQQFASLQELYEQIDQVAKPRMHKALVANKENAFLSEKLFLLAYHDTQNKFKDFYFNFAQWANAGSLFQELEFKSLLGAGTVSKEQKEKLFEYKIAQLYKKPFATVTTPIELAAVASEIETAGIVAIDTESVGPDPYQDQMVGISICTTEQKAYYIPFGHQTDEPQLDLQIVREYLTPVFASKQIKKLFHNAKFDLHMLGNHQLPVEGPIFDTMIAGRLVTREWQRVGLKHMALFYNDEDMLSFKEVVTAQKLKHFAQVDLKLATIYAANDAYQTYKLYKKLLPELEREQAGKLFETIEMPLMHILYGMEQGGIYADKKRLQLLDQEISTALQAIEQEIRALVPQAERAINLNSPKQVEHLLFEVLKLPPQKKKSSGGYSTDQEVLDILAEQHPVPTLIMRYRELAKLQGTYAQALPEYILPKDQKIHASFSQTRVATGRLSCSDPNMQNIPAAGPGLAIRSAFKPAENHIFISADYSQIELRVLAHLSQDDAFKKAFVDNRDIHAETAARLFDVAHDAVTHEQRQVGKRINFSILYGLTPYGLSKDLKIPFGQAKEYIEKYFAQFPKVREWMDLVVEETEQKGYISTYWGRRRYIPAIHEKNHTMRQEAERVAINTVAQGTAAEIVKKGMLALDKILKKLGARMVLQIHDELVVEAPEENAKKVEQEMKKALESVVDWDVPLEAKTRVGADWREVSK